MNISRLKLPMFIITRNFASKFKVNIDSEVNKLFESEACKYRHHPGVLEPRNVDLPKWVLEAINLLTKGEPNQNKFSENSKKLANILYSRNVPPDEEYIRMKKIKVENMLKRKYKVEELDIENHTEGKRLLRENVFNWKPINYNKEVGIIYLITRASKDYSILYKIFKEIMRNNPDFKPKTLFDFGSGVGTVSWAASTLWSDTMKEYFCVDTCSEMHDIAEELKKSAKPPIATTFYRQFFPASPIPKYDIVVSAFSLFELPDAKMRLETILRLWRKTEQYLVIVEHGSNAGFKLVTEARDFILNYKNLQEIENASSGYVLAPCPHDLSCPRYETDDTPCNFHTYCLSVPKATKGVSQGKFEKYSYVVLAKGERPINDKKWPRIVRPTLKKSGYVICRVCTASGKLEEYILTKGKHKVHPYKCARASKWGDCLPLYFENVQNEELVNNLEEENTKEKGEKEEEEEVEEEKEYKQNDKENKI